MARRHPSDSLSAAEQRLADSKAALEKARKAAAARQREDEKMREAILGKAMFRYLNERDLASVILEVVPQAIKSKSERALFSKWLGEETTPVKDGDHPATATSPEGQGHATEPG